MIGDPGLIAQAQDEPDHSALVQKYQRMLLDQLDELPLDGISEIRQIRLRLPDIYIERTLTPIDYLATQIAIDPNTVKPTLIDLLRAPGAQIVLAGAVGSGKSMCLRYLARACVAGASGVPTTSRDIALGWAGALPLPILISAHTLEQTLHQIQSWPRGQQVLIKSHLWHAIEVWLHDNDLGALLPAIQYELEHGRCLLLIDGLDELLEKAAVDDVVAAINQFTLQYPSNRCVIACDHADAAKITRIRGFVAYTFVPLDRSQIDAMVERWYGALASSPRLQIAEEIAGRVGALQGLLHGNALLDELAASPLTLALWIVVHAEGHPLPAARGLILHRLGDLLLNGWAHSSPGGGQSLSQALGIGVAFSVAERQTLLEALALSFGDYPEADQMPKLSQMAIGPTLATLLQSLRLLPDHVAEQVLARLLKWLCCRELLAEVAPRVYTMPRQTLRDYLAVRALANQPDFVDQIATRGAQARWRAALPLVAFELAHSGASQLAVEVAERLMFELTPARTAPDERPLLKERPAHTARWQTLLLAAGCLQAIGAKQAPAALRAAAQHDLVELLGARSTTLAERIQAGTLLGHLGDPRMAQLLPPMAQVAAGPFVLGRKGGYDDEGPEQHVFVPGFAIGIYPVTRQEYAQFLAETGHPLPRYWHDARFNNMSYPIVGVTWHDAVAYCAWLNARLGQAGLRPPDLVVRLPLETEWEKAASWHPHRQTKRLYPWGNEWSNAHANTAAGRGDWMTTPVGCYPDGVSAYGLHDCIGNVWEWTASVYRSYPGAAAPFEEPGSYTLRGSSCVSLATHARCTFRSRLISTYWRYHLGFRIVIARPLSA